VWSVTCDGSARDDVPQLQRRYFRAGDCGMARRCGNPIHNVLLPFVASHIGIHAAFRETVALIHWPLLVVCVALLIRLRPRLADKRMWISGCCHRVRPRADGGGGVGLGAQSTARHPGGAWRSAFRTARRECVWPRRGWRIAFIALLIGCGFLAMADTITRSPLLAYLHSGQGVRDAPQQAIGIRISGWMTRGPCRRSPMTSRSSVRSCVAPHCRGDNALHFAFANSSSVHCSFALFLAHRRARILPRWTPAIAAAIWLISFVRFL